MYCSSVWLSEEENGGPISLIIHYWGIKFACLWGILNNRIVEHDSLFLLQFVYAKIEHEYDKSVLSTKQFSLLSIEQKFSEKKLGRSCIN